jgi:hypothetical protein
MKITQIKFEVPSEQIDAIEELLGNECALYDTSLGAALDNNVFTVTLHFDPNMVDRDTINSLLDAIESV